METKDVVETAVKIGGSGLAVLLFGWWKDRQKDKQTAQDAFNKDVLATAKELLKDTIAELKGEIGRLKDEVDRLTKEVGRLQEENKVLRDAMPCIEAQS